MGRIIYGQKLLAKDPPFLGYFVPNSRSGVRGVFVEIRSITENPSFST